MILNRTGAEFEYEGVTYTIGGAIVGTAESEYAGLYGRINAIHDGEDKETENETPPEQNSASPRCLRHLSEQCLFTPFCRTAQKASLGAP